MILGLGTDSLGVLPDHEGIGNGYVPENPEARCVRPNDGVFDVETIFLFPWAVKYGVMSRQFGFAALGAVFVFLIVVTFAYAYAWRKHALDWVYNE